MERTIWLDGLRGFASFVIALSHSMVDSTEPSSDGVLDFLSRSYWEDPPEENRYIIQLPPFRLMFSAASMVSLLLVISGYAVSIPLLTSRNSNLTGASFFRRLCSTSTRRIVRIFLPTIFLILLTQILYFCDIYQWDPPTDGWVWDLKPLTSPWAHVQYAFWNMLYLLDASNHRNDINFIVDRPVLKTLNPQLWTLPVEIRGSYTIYLLIMTMAFWSVKHRRPALVGMAIYWFYHGQWDLFCLVAGLVFAEGHFAPGKAENKERTQSTNLRTTKSEDQAIDSVDHHPIRTMTCFILGVYFLCMTHLDSLAPEYQFLRVVELPSWDDPEMAPRCWRSLGAVLAFYAISQSTILQRPFNSKIAQYAAKISFSVHLIHQPIYMIVKRPIRNYLWLQLEARSTISDDVKQSKNDLPFHMACAGSALIAGTIVVLVAELWYRVIEVKCLEIANRFENWVTESEVPDKKKGI